MGAPVSEKVSFPGAQGQMLAARLDRPADPPMAQALFAHCFTCSKDSLAAAHIGRALAERGIAVLRFDFTGIGGSGGEFGNDGFSSNIADLVAAAAFLRSQGRAPRLLIGHSLGGAAVLAAASQIAEAAAVCTIAAPSDPAHVLGLFPEGAAQALREGRAEVRLGNRLFTITRQFIEDTRQSRLLEAVHHLGRALLIFHAPHDQIVCIDNAARLYQAAAHPKNFLSLGAADHLLGNPADAVYIADMLTAWTRRYLSAEQRPAEAAEDAAPGYVLVREDGEGRLSQTIQAGRHRLRADEPLDLGGTDHGPSPYDHLLAALGACTNMTLRLYAERKNIPLGPISVRLSHRKIHAEDCATCETKEGRIDAIDRTIAFAGPVSAELRQRLLEIADKCPVHRTLHGEVTVRTRLAE